MLDSILTVGDAVGMHDKAVAASRASSTGSRPSSAPSPPRLRSASAVQPSRAQGGVHRVAGPDLGGHWTPQLIEMAGEEHAQPAAEIESRGGGGGGGGGGPSFGGGGPSFPVNAEAVVESEPDLIVICPCGLDLEMTRRRPRPRGDAPGRARRGQEGLPRSSTMRCSIGRGRGWSIASSGSRRRSSSSHSSHPKA